MDQAAEKMRQGSEIAHSLAGLKLGESQTYVKLTLSSIRRIRPAGRVLSF